MMRLAQYEPKVRGKLILPIQNRRIHFDKELGFRELDAASLAVTARVCRRR